MPATSPLDEATDSRSAQIDLGAIRSNIRAYTSRTGAPVLVRVDHDAYGHGLVTVARAAVEAGASWLGVADVAEAHALRAAGVDVPLLVTGIAPVAGAVPRGVHVAVATPDAAAAAARAGAAGIHLLLDCGHAPRAMALEDAAAVASAGHGVPVTGLLGVYGAAVSLGDAAAALVRASRGIGLGSEVAMQLRDPTGEAEWPTPLDAGGVASGIATVGGAAYGFPGVDGQRRGTPALRAAGRIVTVKRIRAGEGVSYGYTHRAAADGRIGLVTGGYAQGVVRALGNRASVSVRGRRRRIVGRVAMDVCVIELGDGPAAAGDEVVFLGDPERGEPEVGEWMTATGMSASELVVRLIRGFRRSLRS